MSLAIPACQSPCGPRRAAAHAMNSPAGHVGEFQPISAASQSHLPPPSPSPPPAPPPHAAASQTPAVGSDGRLRIEHLAETDRNFGVAIHLSPFGSFIFPLLILAPVVLWLLRKDRSAFVDDHGREMTNVLITGLIVTAVSTVFSLITIGVGMVIAVPLWAIWHIVIIINQVRGALAASRGEYFRYPMVFRFLS